MSFVKTQIFPRSCERCKGYRSLSELESSFSFGLTDPVVSARGRPSDLRNRRPLVRSGIWFSQIQIPPVVLIWSTSTLRVGVGLVLLLVRRRRKHNNRWVVEFTLQIRQTYSVLGRQFQETNISRYIGRKIAWPWQLLWYLVRVYGLKFIIKSYV